MSDTFGASQICLTFSTEVLIIPFSIVLERLEHSLVLLDHSVLKEPLLSKGSSIFTFLLKCPVPLSEFFTRVIMENLAQFECLF